MKITHRGFEQNLTFFENHSANIFLKGNKVLKDQYLKI